MTNDSPLTPAELRVWQSLGRLVHILPRALEEDMSRTGLNMTEFAVLFLLDSAPDRRMRMSDLANAAGLTASRITRVVDGLSRHGYLRKERHSSDRRGSEAILTDRGREGLATAQPAHLASAHRRIIDHLSSADVENLADMLDRILENLSEGRGESEEV
ncbi:hypothetical protein BJF89_16790 [Corynebacterium sp. CNJ-954]|uniref:MarR family winged helix-turn-helix transcriptional regulator n=1 Tax=Corynebacterium sp. CNJ-954 TaxID=1904962 RepID=UPI0009592AE3|nr:MarR family transcriptional regulator [Corynebacterium sp. CNJ-954]OLT54432.1 hypothetical protein BJF89_16790 [Corynebacterium sp. CNJ-954]